MANSNRVRISIIRHCRLIPLNPFENDNGEEIEEGMRMQVDIFIGIHGIPKSYAVEFRLVKIRGTMIPLKVRAMGGHPNNAVNE